VPHALTHSGAFPLLVESRVAPPHQRGQALVAPSVGRTIQRAAGTSKHCKSHSIMQMQCSRLCAESSENLTFQARIASAQSHFRRAALEELLETRHLRCRSFLRCKNDAHHVRARCPGRVADGMRPGEAGGILDQPNPWQALVQVKQPCNRGDRVEGSDNDQLWHRVCFSSGGQGAVQETNDPTIKFKDVWRST
jgi:hypothetical protein